MTVGVDIDRMLGAWLRAESPASAPADLLDSIDAAVAATNRRPRWLVTAPRWAWTARPTPLRVALAVALALLLALAALLAIGSRPRVPPPFGPARPGVFALDIGGDIVSMSPDGTIRAVLSGGDAWDSNPVFSRDGTRLAFWSRETGVATSDLVVIDADGSARRTVARATFVGESSSDRGEVVSWSPDGRWIAYSVTTANRSRIFVARSDAFDPVAVGDAALKGAHPAWSPDGSLIAFAGGAVDAERGVYVMRPDGSGVRRVSTAEGSGDAFAATWSPDGRRLAFAAGDGRTSVWVVRVDGSDERRVDQGLFLGSASWSPDGTRLAWLHASVAIDGLDELDVADADGSNIRRFPHEGIPRQGLAYDGFSPCVGWSPDGAHVIGVLTTDGGAIDRLLEVDPDSGRSIVLPTSGLRAWTQQRLAP